MDNNIYYAVNEYLALWDPIGLPLEIASVEYVDYSAFEGCSGLLCR